MILLNFRRWMNLRIVTGSLIANNTVMGRLVLGGGIAMETGFVEDAANDLTVTNSTFEGNQAIGTGVFDERGRGGSRWVAGRRHLERGPWCHTEPLVQPPGRQSRFRRCRRHLGGLFRGFRSFSRRKSWHSTCRESFTSSSPTPCNRRNTHAPRR